MTKLFNFFKAPEKKRGNLIKCINTYANESRRARAYKRKYWNLAAKLSQYEKHRQIELFTDSVTYDRFDDIVIFLKEKFNHRPSTLEANKGYLIVIMNYCMRQGYVCDKSFSEYSFKKDDPVSIYLTTEEIERIHKLKLKDNTSTIRDIFVVGCCTGLRFSDYSKINTANIQSDTINVKTQKTGAKVVLPVHWMVKEIISRNNGSIPKLELSQQNFNKVIKNIAKKAGINTEILIESMRGNDRIRRRVKKYNLVCTHTARRSFATNMYLAGIPTAKIMLCTGHQTEDSFFKYIRIGKQENAKELSEHPFFRKSLHTV
ncbi:MAG: tyrosine-type recombinase/integrase [Bacteroidales bacterium]|nr:tyrosine-type recombinase/integrase [Bacteroidales bacterium]